MRKLFLILCLVLMTGSVVFSQDGSRDRRNTSSRGGFVGPGSSDMTTVQEALKARDDTPVVLEGVIESRIRGDRYQFRDATGTIIVEIDGDDWRGLTVGPKDIVILHGEVDTRMFSDSQIDVDRIELKQSE